MRAILQRSQIKKFPAGSRVYSSILLNVECRRTLDRQFKRSILSEERFAEAGALFAGYLRSINLIGLDTKIMTRAAEVFYTPLASLDALHLATAMKLESNLSEKPTLLTLDAELATAARAHGFKVE